MAAALGLAWHARAEDSCGPATFNGKLCQAAVQPRHSSGLFRNKSFECRKERVLSRWNARTTRVLQLVHDTLRKPNRMLRICQGRRSTVAPFASQQVGSNIGVNNKTTQVSKQTSSAILTWLDRASRVPPVYKSMRLEVGQILLNLCAGTRFCARPKGSIRR